MGKELTNLVDDGTNGLTYRVIGFAMAVHSDLGSGHRESTYHKAMHIRLVEAGLPAEREPEIPIYNENGNFVNFYRPDHRVSPELKIEYKAFHHRLTNDEMAQCLDYFAAAPECKTILLFNFGRHRLEWQRLFPPKHIQARRQK